jgi:hypothetical protein
MNALYKIFAVFQPGDESFELLEKEEKSLNLIGMQVLVIVAFSIIYGIVMGSFNGPLQALVSGLKLPILILLSLFICFPAFYVIQYMLGSKLQLAKMANIVLSGFVVFSTIILSFMPIVLFFMITSDNYAFLKLLHVAIFIFAGIFGMRIIIQGLKFSCEKRNIYPKLGIRVFKVWIIIFSFVSIQLAWNLRPFVGSKDLPFEIFREKEGNFYLAVLQSVANLFEIED